MKNPLADQLKSRTDITITSAPTGGPAGITRVFLTFGGGTAPGADPQQGTPRVAAVSLHRPPDGPRPSTRQLGIVICPPFGYEHTCAFQTMRLLAEQLAAAGHLVARFDPLGRRGSGAAATDGLQDWTAPAMHIGIRLRDLGAEALVYMGFGMGVVAALRASDHHLRQASSDIVGVALVDPVSSGRRYLRTLRATQLMSAGWEDSADDPGESYTLGERIGPTLSHELQQFNLVQEVSRMVSAGHTAKPAGNLSSPPLLVIARSKSPDQSTWDGFGPGVRVVIDPALEDMTGRGAENALVPVDTIESLAAWVAELWENPVTRVPMVTPPSSVVGHGISARVTPAASESPVEIGTPILRGTWCEPSAEHRESSGGGGTAVLFVNSGSNQEHGPSGAWTDLARRLAACGVSSQRLSVRGFGDSDGDRIADRPGPRGISARQHYRPEFAADLDSAVAEILRRGATDVVVVGLCSSAYSAVDAASRLPAVKAAIAISLNPDHVPSDPWRTRRRIRAARRLSSRRFDVFLRESVLGEKVGRHLPFWAWRVLVASHIAPSPVEGVLRVARSGRDVLVIAPSDEAPAMFARSGRSFRSFAGHAHGRVWVPEAMDHAMFSQPVREHVSEAIVAYIVDGLPAFDRVVARDR